MATLSKGKQSTNGGSYHCPRNNDTFGDGRNSSFERVCASKGSDGECSDTAQTVGFPASSFTYDHDGSWYKTCQWTERCKSTSQLHYAPIYYISRIIHPWAETLKNDVRLIL